MKEQTINWRERLRSECPEAQIPNSQKAARKQVRRLEVMPPEGQDHTIGLIVGYTTKLYELYAVKDYSSYIARAETIFTNK